MLTRDDECLYNEYTDDGCFDDGDNLDDDYRWW